MADIAYQKLLHDAAAHEEAMQPMRALQQELNLQGNAFAARLSERIEQASQRVWYEFGVDFARPELSDAVRKARADRDEAEAHLNDVPAGSASERDLQKCLDRAEAVLLKAERRASADADKQMQADKARVRLIEHMPTARGGVAEGRHDHDLQGSASGRSRHMPTKVAIRCPGCGERDETKFRTDSKTYSLVCTVCGVLVLREQMLESDWARVKQDSESGEILSSLGDRPDPLMSHAFNMSTKISGDSAQSKRLQRAMYEVEKEQHRAQQAQGLLAGGTSLRHKDNRKKAASKTLRKAVELMELNNAVFVRAQQMFAAYRDSREALQNEHRMIACCLVAAIEDVLLEQAWPRLQAEAVTLGIRAGAAAQHVAPTTIQPSAGNSRSAVQVTVAEDSDSEDDDEDDDGMPPPSSVAAQADQYPAVGSKRTRAAAGLAAEPLMSEYTMRVDDSHPLAALLNVDIPALPALSASVMTITTTVRAALAQHGIDPGAVSTGAADVPASTLAQLRAERTDLVSHKIAHELSVAQDEYNEVKTTCIGQGAALHSQAKLAELGQDAVVKECSTAYRARIQAAMNKVLELRDAETVLRKALDKTEAQQMAREDEMSKLAMKLWAGQAEIDRRRKQARAKARRKVPVAVLDSDSD